MIEKITLDMLIQDSVSIKKQNIEIVENEEVDIGYPLRKAYINNIAGRVEVSNEVSEPFLSQIMSVWGENPTVETEPYVEPLPQPKTQVEINTERITSMEDAVMFLMDMSML